MAWRCNAAILEFFERVGEELRQGRWDEEVANDRMATAPFHHSYISRFSQTPRLGRDSMRLPDRGMFLTHHGDFCHGGTRLLPAEVHSDRRSAGTPRLKGLRRIASPPAAVLENRIRCWMVRYSGMSAFRDGLLPMSHQPKEEN